MSHAKQEKPVRFRRRRYFVDPPVQGALLRQAICYWLWASATFAVIVVTYRVFPAMLSNSKHETGRLWYHMAPHVIASVALFPIVVFSAIRFSNRFVGPMVRVRRALAYLANGEMPQHLTVRQGDFWGDIADNINLIAARMRSALPAEAELRVVESSDEDSTEQPEPAAHPA